MLGLNQSARAIAVQWPERRRAIWGHTVDVAATRSTVIEAREEKMGSACLASAAIAFVISAVTI
jgi:erythromycin esterase-like protein